MNPKMRIPAGAPKAVGLAADEFAKYWKLVTGRDIVSRLRERYVERKLIEDAGF